MEVEEGGEARLRLITAPVFNLYRFGATQFRVGGAYDFEVNPSLVLGIPVSFTMGGGFSSIQGGFEVGWHFLQYGRTTVFWRSAFLFERFFGNGRSFVGLAVDQGLGLNYFMSENIFVTFEPVSIELMPWATHNIPWNLRGQVLLSFGGKW